MKLIRQKRRFLCRGVAAVEAAIIAPLMVTALLAMIEVGYSFMIRQTVTLASREGAREAALPGGTMTDVNTAVDDTMAAASLSGYTVTSNLPELAAEDTEVWVSVSLPFDRASFTGSFLGGGSFNIAATTTMRREGVD